jgi:gliding motility-associatede transport system auxiliary component
MKKKTFQTGLFSVIGVAAMLLILVAINFIAGRVKQRVDLTAEHAYTLSAGTKAILAKLDTPVQIRFYASQSAEGMPVFLKTYAQQVDDLLGEFRQNSRGLIQIRKLDPEPDSDAEDSAKLEGVEPQLLSNGERVYLGLSVSLLDQKEAIPFLSPERERLLEYDISRAIARVMTPDKPVIGVLSSLPVMGTGAMMPMQQRGEPPWVLIEELKRDFDVKEIEPNATTIPDNVKVLLVIHPKGISEATEFALDQFVLRGGKLIAFLDPMAALDPQSASASFGSPPSKSVLDRLLKAWGLTFEDSKVLADLDFVGRTSQGRAPAVLALNEKAVNKDDIATADAGNLFVVFGGVFGGTPAPGLKETVLLHSSKDSELVDPMMAQMSGEQIATSFKPSGIEHPLAIRLSGKFKTAFPAGKPKPPEAEPNEKKEEASAPETMLKESKQETTVVLIGDSDMIQDRVAVRQVGNPFGQRLFMPANGNLAFAENLIDQLTGDSNLIAVRSRASRERPFTVVKKMQADAEASYRSKIKELEDGLADAQRKIGQLQSGKQEGQRFILSPQQQEELANFRKKEAEAKTQLKEVRKKLRADIDSLENRIKWLDIAGMPALVAVTGLVFAIVKRRRSAAR